MITQPLMDFLFFKKVNFKIMNLVSFLGLGLLSICVTNENIFLKLDIKSPYFVTQLVFIKLGAEFCFRADLFIYFILLILFN